MEDKTIQILRSSLEKSPELWDTRQHLAELLWAQGDIQGTSDVLGGAPQWPSDEANLEFAASVFAHTNHPYSIDLYHAVIERNPGNPRAHAALSRLHMEAGDRENSSEHYLAATALDPTLADPQIAFWLQGGAPTPAGPELDIVPTGLKEVEEQPPGDRVSPSVSSIGAPAVAIRPSAHPQEFSGQFNMEVLSPITEHASEQQDAEIAEEEKKKQITSLIAAALVHVAIGAVLYFWIIHNWEDPPVLVITSDQGDPGKPKVEKKSFAKAVRRKPNPASSSARAQIVTANVATPIAVEAVEEIDPDAFGVANNFGVGMGFGNGNGGGGGSVMFFGDSAQVSRAVFVVDFSSSMNEGGRIGQLKKELDTSLSQLPKGVSYNIIYYSHRPWLGGETVGNAPFRDHEDAEDRLPWLQATPDNIQKSREQVGNMRPSGATNWIPPIRMALAMVPRPNVIWLLTDGEASDREEMIADMASINPGKVRINTICMEIGGPTFQSLIESAEMTGGKFSIVMNGELFTGGAARKFTDQQYAPQ